MLFDPLPNSRTFARSSLESGGGAPAGRAFPDFLLFLAPVALAAFRGVAAFLAFVLLVVVMVIVSSWYSMWKTLHPAGL
jgi:hypothetical protein